jgi:hypothetical protein
MKTSLAFFTLLAALSCTPAQAQSTYTAASCNFSDVNAVINGPTHKAVSGDTITIPAGNCTWTNSLSIMAGITLTGSGTPNTGPSTFGAGTPTTTIVDNAGSSNPLFTVTGITYGQTFTLALLDIEPQSSSTQLMSPISIAGTCLFSGCPNIRIHNIAFGLTTHWTEAGNGAQADSMIRTDNVFGVIDHNTMPPGASSTFANISHSAYLGVGSFGDNSYAQPDSFGGANNVFIENNSLYNALTITDTEFPPAGGGVGGGRQVGRFNQINSIGGSFEAFAGHGLDTDGRPQGVRQIEVYGNTITCTGGGCNTAAASYRGGTGLVFGNTITANYPVTGGYYNAIANITVYRTVFAAGGGWGACGGSSPYDTNDGIVYYGGTVTSSGGLTMTDASKTWTANQFIPTGAPFSVYNKTQGFWSEITSNTANTITIAAPISESGWTGFNNGDSYQILRATVCADQGGRGAGNYVSGMPLSSASALSQAFDPIYEFADIFTGSLNQGHVTSNTGRTIANRDWYTDNGAGMQTSPSSPFNGTSGVGWGTIANRPSTCTPHVGYWATDQGNWNQSSIAGQGELFVCTAINTWGLYYMPYPYPHPLIQGIQVAGALAPPTNVITTSH